MADSSPLSYQTTMPDPIDTSYQAYSKEMGTSGPRFIQSLATFFSGKPSYQQWQNSKMNDYNMRMQAYNTWLSTGAGQRASAESGNYNPSYFGVGSPSASPVDYQIAPESSGFNEIAQGASGVLSLVQALQQYRLVASQIKGQELKNDEQVITNTYLPALLLNRSNFLGYQAGNMKFNNELLFGRRFGLPAFNPDEDLTSEERASMPVLKQSGLFHYGGMDYDLSDVDKAFGYQEAASDIAYRNAATGLQNINAKVASLNAKEKQFYIDNILPWLEVQAIEQAGLTRARKFSEREHKRLMSRQGKKLDIQNVYEKDLKELEVKGKKYGLSKKALDSVLSVAKEARGWVSTFVPHKSMRL